jgi:hypothetical protein
MPKFQAPAEAATFLAILADGLSVTAAARAAGVARCTPYRWRADRAFAEAWADAIEAGTDRLEDEALRRAVERAEKPAAGDAKSAAASKTGSDSLLMALLAARRPEKFRTNPRTEPAGRKDVSSEGARAQLERKLARLAQRQAPKDLSEKSERE